MAAECEDVEGKSDLYNGIQWGMEWFQSLSDRSRVVHANRCDRTAKRFVAREIYRNWVWDTQMWHLRVICALLV